MGWVGVMEPGQLPPVWLGEPPTVIAIKCFDSSNLTQFHNVMDNVSGAPHPLKDFEFFAYIQNLVLESPIFIGKGHGYILCINLSTMTLLASLFNAKQPLMSCHIWDMGTDPEERNATGHQQSAAATAAVLITVTRNWRAEIRKILHLFWLPGHYFYWGLDGTNGKIFVLKLNCRLGGCWTKSGIRRGAMFGLLLTHHFWTLP